MVPVPGVVELMRAARFEHEWLSESFVAESQRLAVNERSRKHHYVPQMYLDRWAVNGLVQPVQVDSGQMHRPQPPHEVAHEKNFYSLPSTVSTMSTPLKWIEKHLSRIEGTCARHLGELEKWGAGVVSDPALKSDLAVFLGLQITRTVSSRERALVLVKGPDAAKREYLELLGLDSAEIDESMNNRQPDPKHEALDLMLKDVQNVTARGLHLREWALYRTASPLVTCDDPVVLLAGPGKSRTSAQVVGSSAVALYPLNPRQGLVMLAPGLHHRGPYLLDAAETAALNVEIVAAATKTTFERPGDDIAAGITVPPWPERDELDDETVAQLSAREALKVLLDAVTPRTRWTDSAAAPAWPVPRWYGH